MIGFANSFFVGKLPFLTGSTLFWKSSYDGGAGRNSWRNSALVDFRLFFGFSVFTRIFSGVVDALMKIQVHTYT